MILGTGVDLVETARFISSEQRWGEKFARKILSASELDRYNKLGGGRVQYLARQFAAKEAVSKALGTGMGHGVHFTQITVGRHKSGAPFVELSGRAQTLAEKAGICRWHISISDEKQYGVAFAIAED